MIDRPRNWIVIIALVGRYLQLKVQLLDVEPPIWRKFVVPGEFGLSELHAVLQVVMGWLNAAPYVFNVDDVQYSTYEIDDVSDENPTIDEAFDMAPGGFLYTYDLEEEWMHHITLEHVFYDEEELPPLVLDAERACPVEGCGGPKKYAKFLVNLANPNYSRHKKLMEIAGPGFQPEFYSIRQATSALIGWWQLHQMLGIALSEVDDLLDEEEDDDFRDGFSLN